MEILQLLCSRCYCPANIPLLNCQFNYSAISSQAPLQNSTELIALTALVITSRHGPHRKHRYSTVAFVFIAAGTCLPNCCPETDCIKPFIKNPLPQQRVHMLQLPGGDMTLTGHPNKRKISLFQQKIICQCWVRYHYP
jgi:hypothetical protein